MAQHVPEEAVGAAALVGRDEPLSRLEAAVALNEAGSGRVVWVTGEAGIGKTSLLSAAARAARRAGATVLTATAWDDPGTPPLWIWAQVVRAAANGRDTAQLAEAWGRRALPALALVDPLSHAELRDPDDAGAFGRFSLFDALDAVIEQLARSAPVVIVLDDLHWADVGSLQALHFLAKTTAHRRVLVLCGWREHEVEPGAGAGRLASEIAATADRLPLAGLSADDVAALVNRTGGLEVSPDRARQIAERTGGNPLFVGELARLLRDRGDSVSTTIPETANAIIRRRLARLSQPCHDLLAAAAVAGPAATYDALAAVTRRASTDVAAAADEAVTAGLATVTAGRVGLAHPLVRDTVIAALPAARARQLHRTVADLLRPSVDADPATAAAVAHHLLAALPLGTADEAARMLGRASAAALGACAYEEAVGHGRAALQVLEPGSPLRFGLLLGQGEALLASGDPSGARAAYTSAADLARASGDGADLARAALGFSAGLAGFEVRLWDRAQLDLLEEALAALPEGDSVVRADLMGRLSVASAFTERAGRRLDLADGAVAMARRLGEPRALARALAAQCDAIAGPDDTARRLASSREGVRLAQEGGDRGLVLLGLRLRVVARLECGQDRDAAADMREFGRVAEELRQPLYGWYVPLWRGYRAYVDGDLALLAACAAEVAATGELAGSRNAATLAIVQRMWLANAAGRLDGLLSEMGMMLTTLPELQPDGNDLVIWLHPSQPPAVRAAALKRLDPMLASMTVDSEYVSNLCHYAGELFDARDAARYAQALHDRLLPHADGFAIDGIAAGTHGSVHRLVGAMAALLGDTDRAISCFERAIVANLGSTVPTQETLRMYAVTLARRDQPGDRERATELAGILASSYAACGIERPLPRELRGLVAADADEPAGGAASWLRAGEVWEVAYRGRSVVLRPSKGMDDLVELIRRPGREVHVLDLVGRDATTRARGHSGPVDGGRPGDLGEVLDGRAREDYRRRLADLATVIAEAEDAGDLVGAERAQGEREALVDGLSAAYGLGGRTRRTGDPAERARSTVTWRIRDAIRRIEAVHPELARHLRASVRTGVFCGYEPEHDPQWEL